MYFVDRKKIESTLIYMKSTLILFESQQSWESHVEKLALERIGQVIIEAVIDVGNKTIDGFIMRDPGSYADIIDILCDEGVITNENAKKIKEVIDQRKVLVRAYEAVDHEVFLDLFYKNFSALKAFPDCVRSYLDNELGPVSAFLPYQNL